MHNISNAKNIKLKTLNPIFILFITLVLIILLGVVNSPLNVYAKTTAKMNISQSADSYLYYMALRECVINNQLSYSQGGQNKIIAESDADKLNWFGSNPSDPNDGDIMKAVGGYTNGKPTNQIVDTLHCQGKPSNTIKNALAAWGYNSGTEALCAFGLKRRNIYKYDAVTGGGKATGGEDVDCLTGGSGQDEFYSDDNGRISLSNFDKAIKEKIGTPEFTQAIKYHLYRQALFTGCLGVDAVKNPTAKPNEYTGIEQSSATNKIYKILDVDEDGNVKEKIYEGKKDKNSNIIFYLTPRSWTTMTCGELEVHLNSSSLSKAYANKLSENLKDPEIDKEGKEPEVKKDATCGSEMKLLGWIICPIIEGLAGLNDIMFKLIESLLVANPLTQDDNTFKAWGSMRNLANAAFVIAFLIIIFSQMSGAGITNYGIKKLLPKLIVCAILVNLSYLIMQVLVDIANITGSSIYGVMKSMTEPVDLEWKSLFNLSIAGGAVTLAGVASVTILGTTMIWIILPMVLMGALAMAAAFATLVFRQAAIPILAIISPLAFVAYLLPNTESWFKKWKDTFTSMLVLYPTAALLFGGCYFVSHMMVSKDGGGDWWQLMMGLVVMSLPLFALPFIAKQGGAILSKVNGALSGAADKFKKPVGNWSSKNAERASEASKNRAMNSDKPSFRRTYLRRQARLDGIKKSQSDSFNRAQAGYVASEAENNPDYLNKLAAGGGAGARDQALANAKSINAKITADEVTAQTALIKDISDDDRKKLTMGGEVDLKNASGQTIGKLNSNTNAALRTAAMKMSIDMNDTGTINKLLDQSAAVDANGNDVMNMETRTSLGNILLESGGTPTYVSKSIAGQIKQSNKDINAGNSADIITASLTKGVYSADKIASASDSDLDSVINVLEGRPANYDASDPTNNSATTTRTVNHDALIKLKSNLKTVNEDTTYSGKLSKQQNQVDSLTEILNRIT